MRKLNVILCSAVFSVAALATTSALAEGEAAAKVTDAQGSVADAAAAPVTDAQTSDGGATTTAATAEQASTPLLQTPKSQNSLSEPEQAAVDPADPYQVTTFFADFTRFTLGDVVPDSYRTKKYTVSDWKTRNLPAPEAGSHWTYMGGNYVQISDAEGKILSAKSGEIFYKQ